MEERWAWDRPTAKESLACPPGEPNTLLPSMPTGGSVGCINVSLPGALSSAIRPCIIPPPQRLRPSSVNVALPPLPLLLLSTPSHGLYQHVLCTGGGGVELVVERCRHESVPDAHDQAAAGPRQALEPIAQEGQLVGCLPRRPSCGSTCWLWVLCFGCTPARQGRHSAVCLEFRGALGKESVVLWKHHQPGTLDASLGRGEPHLASGF